MSLTLVTNPVSDTAEVFAGLQPIEYIFKREDLAITSVTSGTGGAKINHSGDLTSYLSAGDKVYLYSPGTNYTYDEVGTILSIVAGEITTDIDYIETGTGGYINYFFNYYVELQCVNKDNDDINLLPFSLESDGDSAGNIIIDVSIMNDLNIQRGDIAKEALTDSRQEFEVKYRQVYDGSSESFTLINNSLVIALYCTETPETEEILNRFDLPEIYLGYPAGICVAHKDGLTGDNLTIEYDELDINQNILASDDLGNIDSGYNGFLLWEWDASATVEDATKYIEFSYEFTAGAEYNATDYNSTDYQTT